MKILHLYSNWKWTGPAEHALNVASHLFRKGHDLTFACGKPPQAADDSLEKRARENGLILANHFYLNKHFNVGHDAIDIIRLVSLIREKKYEIIHTHLFNDHFIVGIAARCISKRITLLRTVYDGTGLDNTIRNRALLSYFTDGLIAVSAILFPFVFGAFSATTVKWYVNESPGKYLSPSSLRYSSLMATDISDSNLNLILFVKRGNPKKRAVNLMSSSLGILPTSKHAKERARSNSLSVYC